MDISVFVATMKNSPCGIILWLLQRVSKQLDRLSQHVFFHISSRNMVVITTFCFVFLTIVTVYFVHIGSY